MKVPDDTSKEALKWALKKYKKAIKRLAKKDLGFLLFCSYALLIVVVGLSLGEIGLFWLPIITILLIWILV